MACRLLFKNIFDWMPCNFLMDPAIKATYFTILYIPTTDILTFDTV